MACLEIRDPVVVDNFDNAHLIDVVSALLTLVVVDQDHILRFAGYRFNQTRRFYTKLVQCVLRLPVYAAQTDCFDVLA